MSDQIMRIAAWSGPRTISTAFMRSWENRPDTYVYDEPLYAHYLQETGIDHPDAQRIIDHGEPNCEKVLEELLGPIPRQRIISFQKHMAHHLLPNISRDWLEKMSHIFLIRDPAKMLRSIDVKLQHFDLQDTGLPQLLEIFEYLTESSGSQPLVVDSEELLKDPRAHLSLLCEHLKIPFYEEMLSWPPGRRDTDGIWAEHWYGSVENSTGFKPYEERDNTLPARLTPLYEKVLPFYESLHKHRITP